jgi:hypothetical protein
MKIKKIKL